MTILTTLPTDAFVAAALRELLDDVTNLLESTKAQKPLDRDEIKFWRSQLNALNKAESYWLQGVRPQIATGTYLLASASRPGALIHRLSKAGGIVVCSCEAGQRGLLCWHHMLVNVIERASELESLALAKAEEVSEPDTMLGAQIAAMDAITAQLAARLEATAAILDTMRAAQGRSSLSCDPPDEPNPLGDTEGDEPPARRLGVRLATARKRSGYFTSAFYLGA